MSPHAYTFSFAVVIFVVLAISGESTGQGSKAVIIDIKSRLLFNVSVMRNQKKPHVVFYYAASECASCEKNLIPALKNQVVRKGEYLNMAIINFDKVPELREEHGVSVIPTVMVYYKGEIMDILEGDSFSPMVGLVNRAAKLVQ